MHRIPKQLLWALVLHLTAIASWAEVTLEETQTGGATGSAFVVTSATVSGVDGHLYVAAVSSKTYQPVTSVLGLGLTWSRVVAQCSGRKETGIELWTAQGTPSGGGVVVATLARVPDSAVLAVLRYSGVDTFGPTGNLVSGNSNGAAGVCSGGTDGDAYSLQVSTTAPGSVVLSAAAMRTELHEPGIGYTERVEFHHGGPGSTGSSVAAQDSLVATPTTIPVDGTFSSNVDWAAAALVLQPVGASSPDIALTPAAHDYGTALLGISVINVFQIQNDGNADLLIQDVQLVGTDPLEFARGSIELPLVLQPQQSKSLIVSFLPTSTGPKSATLRITSNDPNENPLDAFLQGHGLAFPTFDITVTPSSYDFGPVAAGATAAKTFKVCNNGSDSLTVTATQLTGPDAAEFDITGGSGPFPLGPGQTNDIDVDFHPSFVGSFSATLRIDSTDPARPTVDVPLAGTGVSGGLETMWISPSQLLQKPTLGGAWSALVQTADGDLGTPDIADLHTKHDVKTLAVALAYARTGSSAYRQKAFDAIMSAVGTDSAASAHDLGRNLVCYVISAGLIELSAYDPAADTVFRDWIDAARFVQRSGGTLISRSEVRANNHGRYCGASRVAVAIYLGDQTELDRAAQVFKGFLGDRESYAGFNYVDDLSWQADPNEPVGINPLGAMRNGYSIDGALPEEMRRGCPFTMPPCWTDYVWDAVQGMLVEAVLLSRQGYDVFNWQDQAILRAIQFLDHLALQYPNTLETWWADGDDTYIPWVVNSVYGTSFPTSPAEIGDNMGWTDWTHASLSAVNVDDNVDIDRASQTPATLGLPYEPHDGGAVELPYSVAGVQARVQLEIFNVRGQRVRVLRQGWHTAGEYKATWDRRNESNVFVSRGVYFVRLTAGRATASRKLFVRHR